MGALVFSEREKESARELGFCLFLLLFFLILKDKNDIVGFSFLYKK